MTTSWPAAFHKRRFRGFTLVELIVAMGITTIILTLLVSITGVALDGWRVSRNKVRAARQAKAALDQVSKDFESMVVRSGNNYEWLFANEEEVESGDVTGGNAAQIVFFTAATDRYNGQIGVDGVDLGGDVSGVGYRLVYKDPVKNDQGQYSVFALYRNLVDPKDTFDDLLAKEELMASGGNSGPFQEYMTDVDDISNFVCENIYEMTMGFLVEYSELKNGALITKHQRLTVIDTSGGGDTAVSEIRVKGNGIFAKPEPAAAEQIEAGRIVAIDVAVTVITDHAMGVLKNNTQLTGDKLAEFIAKNSYRYTKTVIVPQS